MGRLTGRILKIVAGVLLLIVLVVGVAFWWVSRKGSSALEQWIGEQLKTIAGAYIRPSIEFEDLDYEYPRTVSLKKFRLTAEDPDHPGQRVAIVEVADLRLELAEIPSSGKPLRIEKMVLDHPMVRVIWTAADPGSFIGFSGFMVENATRPQTEQPKQVRLSEVFQIRMLELKSGAVIYQTRTGKAVTMRLDDITCKLNVEPVEQGWYGLALNLERAPVFDLKAAGRLDLDHMVLQTTQFDLNMKAGREQDRYLPPALQELLQAYQVAGQFKISLLGQVPLTDAMASNITCTLEATGVKFVAGDYKGEVKLASGILSMAERKLKLTGPAGPNKDRALVQTLDGEVTGKLVVDLDSKGTLDLALGFKDLRLEEMLRSAGGEPKFSGLGSAPSVTFSGPLAELKTKAAGGGTAPHITQGKVTALPVINKIDQMLAGALKVASLNRVKPRTTDRLDADFKFLGDRVHFDSIVLDAPIYTINADGDVYFDGRLDMTLKPAVSKSGSGIADVAGSVFSAATGQVGQFTLTGTIHDPKLTPRPFGGVQDEVKDHMKLPGLPSLPKPKLPF